MCFYYNTNKYDKYKILQRLFYIQKQKGWLLYEKKNFHQIIDGSFDILNLIISYRNSLGLKYTRPST